MGLIYTPDSAPGHTRRRCGRGFTYLSADGTRIADADEIARIKALAIPPAWDDVWISPHPNGHLQATGRDGRGRKQYRYHPDWAERRAASKFDRLEAFGTALPAIRRWIETRLRGEPGDLDTAVAAVLALLDRASLRVGSADYADENGTHGATTLLPEHALIDGAGLRLRFPAKGGDIVETRLTGGRLARVLDACQDLPGADLITHGEGARVRSEHLSDVLSGIVGEDVRPKTFRTWNGSHAAFLAATRDTTIRALSEAAAERLHNTPAIARKSYIHPKVVALSQTGTRATLEPDTPAGYRRGEAALLDLLRG